MKKVNRLWLALSLLLCVVCSVKGQTIIYEKSTPIAAVDNDDIRITLSTGPSNSGNGGLCKDYDGSAANISTSNYLQVQLKSEYIYGIDIYLSSNNSTTGSRTISYDYDTSAPAALTADGTVAGTAVGNGKLNDCDISPYKVSIIPSAGENFNYCKIWANSNTRIFKIVVYKKDCFGTQLTETPQNAANAAPTGGSTQLSWDAPTTAVSPSTLVYTIELYESATVTGNPVRRIVNVSSPYNLTGLQAETDYVARIYAVGDAVNDCDSTFADVSFITAACTGTPLSTVGKPSGSDETSEGFTVHWTAVANAVGYVVNVYDASGVNLIATHELFDGSLEQLAIGGLKSSTGYTVEITALGDNDSYCSASPSEKSDVITTLAPSLPPEYECENFDAAVWSALSNGSGNTVDVVSATGTWKLNSLYRDDRNPYSAPNTMRFGTSGATLQTPSLSNGVGILSFRAQKGNSVLVELYNASNTKLDSRSFTTTASWEEYTWAINNSAVSYIKFVRDGGDNNTQLDNVCINPICSTVVGTATINGEDILADCDELNKVLSFELTLTGQAAGASIQWQSSTTGDLSDYSDMPLANTTPYEVTTLPTVSTWYRAKVTMGCVAYSVPVQYLPALSLQPVVCKDTTYKQYAVAEEIITEATGAVSWQWYKNTTASTVGGTLIAGATESHYTPGTSELGTFYYYCGITDFCDNEEYTTPCAVKVEPLCVGNSRSFEILKIDFGVHDSHDYIGEYEGMDTPYSGSGDLNAGGSYRVCVDPRETTSWAVAGWDHTGNGDGSTTFGGMLFVNGAEKPVTVLDTEIDGLCKNTFVALSAWAANAHNDANDDNPPTLTFSIHDADTDEVLSEYTTPLMHEEPTNNLANRWTEYSLPPFNTGNRESLRLKITNNTGGEAGNDFVVDDIIFSVCVPDVTVYINDTTSQKVACGTTEVNLSIPDNDMEYYREALPAVFETGYVLWQYSDDGAVSWTNFPEPIAVAEGYSIKDVEDSYVPPLAGGERLYRAIFATSAANCLDIAAGETSSMGCNAYVISSDAVQTCCALAEPGVITNTGDSILTCTNKSITLTADSDPSYIGYLWFEISGGGKDTVKIGGTPVTTRTLNVDSIGHYQVEVINTDGCKAYSAPPVVVQVDTVKPVFSIDYYGKDEGKLAELTCDTLQKALFAKVEGDESGLTYRWSNLENSSNITVSTADEYSLTITGTNGCSAQASVEVSENKTPPTLCITDPPAVCEGSSINLTNPAITNDGGSCVTDAGAVLSYYTNSEATLPLANYENITASGTYYIKATAENGCSGIEPVHVVINDKPVLSARTLETCEPNAIDIALSATLPAYYKYYSDAGAASELASTKVGGFTGTQDYYISYFDGNCTSELLKQPVTINPQPKFSIKQPDSVVCAPTVVNIAAAGFIVPGEGYAGSPKYYSDAACTTELTGASLNISAVGVHSYWVVGFSAHCSDTIGGKVTINAKPVLQITNPDPVCAPATVDLTEAAVTAGSTLEGAALSYWLDEDATNNAALDETQVDNGTYYIMAKVASTGCFDIKPVTVTVNEKPTVQVSNPAAVCSPATVDLTAPAVTAGSTPGLTYTYFNDNADKPGSEIADASKIAASGKYWIVGTNATTQCADTAAVTVTINPKPELKITNPDPVCSPATVNLTEAAITAGSTLLGGDLTYWNDEACLSSVADETQAGNGTYYIKVLVAATTCADTAAVTVTVNPKPEKPAVSDYKSCPTNASENGNWSDLAKATGTNTLNWYQPKGTAATPPTTFDKHIEDSVMYWVTQTATYAGGFSCESDVDSVKVVIENKPFDADVDNYIECAAATSGTKTWASLVKTSGTQHWYTSLADAQHAENEILPSGEFNLDVANAAGDTLRRWVTVYNNCLSNPAEVKVFIKARPAATISGTATICEGQSTGLTISFTGTAPFTFRYTPSPGLQTADITFYNSLGTNDTIITVTPSTTTSYTITQLSDANCSAVAADMTGTATITVNKVPQLSINNPAPVCDPETVEISGTATNSVAGAEPVSYKYYSAADCLPANEITNTEISGVQTMSYWVVGTSLGCSDTIEGVLTIKKKPSIPTVTNAELCYDGKSHSPTVVRTETGSEGGLAWYTSEDGMSSASLPSRINVGISSAWVADTLNGCSSDRVEASVTVNAKPALTITSPAAVCYPATVNIENTATGADSYTYYSNEDCTDELLGTDLIFNGVQTATPYWVIGKFSVGGCTDTIQGSVTIKAKPEIVPPVNATMCEGTTLDLDTTAITLAGGSWTSSDATIAWVDASSGVVTAVKFGIVDISYTVNACSSDAITITVNRIPDAPIVQNYIACPTLTSEMKDWEDDLVTANKTNLTWYDAATEGNKVGEPLPFDTQTEFAAEYWITETVDGCESSRTSIKVDIAEPVSAPVIEPFEQCEEASGTKPWAEIVGMDPSVLYWYNDETTAANDATAESTANAIGTPADIDLTTPVNTSLWVVIKGGDCYSQPAEVTVNIKARPTATLVGDTTICNGSNTANALQVNFTGTAPFEYRYDANGVTTALINSAGTLDTLKNLTPNTTTVYELVYLKDATGCGAFFNTVDRDDRKATVTVNDKPEIADEITAPALTCAGMNNINIAPTSVNWNGDGSGDGSWFISTTTEAVAFTSITMPYSAAYDKNGYSIIYVAENSCGTDTGKVLLSIKDTAEITEALTVSPVCAGKNLTLTAPTVDWKNDPDINSEEWKLSDAVGSDVFVSVPTPVTISDNGKTLIFIAKNSCGSDTVETTITVNDEPTITAPTLPDAICAGESLNLPAVTVADNGSAITNQGWLLDDVIITSSDKISFAKHNATLKYFAVNGCDSVWVEVGKITVRDVAEITGTLTVSPVCAGENLTLNAPVVDWKNDEALNTSSEWKLSDAVGSDVFISVPAPVVASDHGKTLIFIANNSCGSDTVETTITVNNLPDLVQDFTIEICDTEELSPNPWIVDKTLYPDTTWQIEANAGAKDYIEISAYPLPISYATDKGKEVLFIVKTICGSDTARATVMGGNSPSVGTLATPAAVCEGVALSLVAPSVSDEISGRTGWEIETASDVWEEFVPATPMVYATHNGKNLRYWAGNDCDTVYSNTAAITVHTKPSITLNGSPAAVLCEGDSLTLTSVTPLVDYRGASKISEGWLLDGVPYVLETALVAADHHNKELKYYAKNDCGSDTVEVAIITVNTKQKFLTALPAIDICGEEELTLTEPWATADRTLVTGSYWQIEQNAGAKDYSNIPSFPLHISYAADNGKEIIFVATADCGNDTARVTIRAGALPAINGTLAASYSACEGVALSLVAPSVSDEIPGRTGWQIETASDVWEDFDPATLMDSTTHDGKNLRYWAGNDCDTVYSNTATIIVNTKPAKPAAVVPPATVCAGENLALPVQNWQIETAVNSGYFMPFAAPYTVSAEHSGRKLFYEISNSCGSTQSDTVLVSVASVPEILAPVVPETLCVGDSLKPKAVVVSNGGEAITNYEWFFSDDLLTPIYSSSTDDTLRYEVKESDNGRQLILKVSNLCGDAASTPAILQVGKVPVVSKLASIAPVCEGSSLILTAPQVEWNGLTTLSQGWEIRLNGSWQPFDPHTTPMVYATHNDSLLRYMASSSCGTAYSDTATIVVNEAVTAEAGRVDNISCVCLLSTAQLAADAPSVGTGKWTQTAGTAATIEDVTSPASVVNGLSPGIYTFRWTVTNDLCQASDEVSFSVLADNEAPVVHLSIAELEAQSAGNDCKFTVPDLSSYVNYKHDDCTPENELIYHQTPVAGSSLNNTTAVRVWLEDSCGKYGTPQVVVVTVNNSLPKPVIVGNFDPACSAGANLQLSVDNTAGMYDTIYWEYNGVDLGLDNQYVLNGVSQEGEYRVIVENAAGCTNTSVVNVGTMPFVYDVADIVLCHGEDFPGYTFNHSSNAEVYWEEVVGYDPIGGSGETEGVGLPAKSGIDVLPAFTAKNSSAYPIRAVYRATPRSSSCIGEAKMFIITVNPVPGLAKGVDNRIYCYGTQVPNYIFTTDVVNTDFEWKRIGGDVITEIPESGDNVMPGFTASPSRELTAQYEVKASFNNAGKVCSASESFKFSITLLPQFSVSVAPEDQTVISGNSLTEIVFTPTSSKVDSIRWERIQGQIPGLATSGTGNTIAAQTLTSNDSQNLFALYQVTPYIRVSEALTCEGKPATFSITLKPEETLECNLEIVKQPENQNICGDGTTSVTLYVEAVGKGAIKYQWYEVLAGTTHAEKRPLSGETAATLKLNYDPSMSGNEYQVEVSNDCGKILSSSYVVLQGNNLRVVQEWSDVLYVEGHEHFSRFQWYKDDYAIKDNAYAPYYSNKQGLNGTYKVRAYYADGSWQESCPMKVVSESQQTGDVIVAPNPTNINSSIVVTITDPSFNISEAKIEIFSENGQLVGTYPVTGETTTVPTPGVAGNYIVRVTPKLGSIVVKKIIVKD
ncbi:MAG: T9SS type A sorting domain-containing protein [Prevotellaceae bacterium]|jgi:archaellum component FlaG (FlaF/FlaG flagellin family)|nr:T9SS type A sorting domain-containing protein [Prevotellaceae bacterium]